MEESGESALAYACPHCGEAVDVSGFMPFEKIACPHCGTYMRVRVQFDHYRIQELRGLGGMSQVFTAMDSHLNRLVALKVLNRENSTKDERIAQFEREARLTASISHPNVVRVYGVGHDLGNLYIAMELVDGASLEEMLRDQERLPEPQVLDLAIEATEGLAAAFRVGLIHRDIKPGNILLTTEGKAKLVDFGLALVFEKDVDDSDELWATPHYVPPEKLTGGTEDFRSDIYSLGSTLFHLLAGRPPYDSASSSVEELREIKSRPVRLGAFAPMISHPTQAVVDRMMALRPEERFQSYEELLAALRAARRQLLESLGMARPATREDRRLEMRRKNRRRMLIGVAGIGVFLAAILLWKIFSPPPKTSPENTGTGTGGEGWEVGTLEEGNVGERFLQARRTLKEGKLAEARGQFLGIFEEPRTRQPTANWAATSVVLVDLLSGEPGRARETAGKMKNDPRFQAGKGGEAGALFQRVVDRMLSPWPVPAREIDEIKSHRDWQAEALLVGLKDWQHGRFADAAIFLEAVRASELPKELDWIADLGATLGRYILDAGTLSGLGARDEFTRSADVETALSECRTALGQLRTTDRAKRWLEERVKLLEARRDKMAASEHAADEKELQARTAKELEELRALATRLAGFRAGYRFDEAVNEIRGGAPATPAGKDGQAALLWLWQGGGEFLSTLAADLCQFGYRGNLQPKESGVVYTDIDIKKAGKTTLVVTGRLGLINVPVAQVPPAQLAALGLAMLEKQSGDAAALATRRGLLARFYLCLGAAAEAEKTVAAMPEDKDFSARWQSAMATGRETAAP